MTAVADVGAGGDPRVYVAGDYLELLVTVTDGAGAPVNLAGATAIRYAVTRRGPGGAPILPAVIVKSLGSGVAVTDAAAGKFTVTLANGETGALAGTYRHEAEVTDADGRISTVFIGAFGIEAQAILPVA
jgi:hypothetical protein